jgi:hypothetical protein
LLRKHCFLPMFRHVSQSGQTLGNINEKHRETSNVSEFARKHFCFSGSKFCFRNNVSIGGQTGKHLRKHHESQMFPQQCFLVCPGLYTASKYLENLNYRIKLSNRVRCVKIVESRPVCLDLNAEFSTVANTLGPVV